MTEELFEIGRPRLSMAVWLKGTTNKVVTIEIEFDEFANGVENKERLWRNYERWLDRATAEG